MTIKFHYTAKDKEGNPAAGSVEAEDRDKALDKIQELRRQGFADISIDSAGVVEKTSADVLTRKKCPFCAEEILEEAVVCRFCRMDLRTRKPLPVAGQAPSISPEKAGTPVAAGEGVKIGLEIFVVLPFVLILVITGVLIFSGGLAPLLTGISSPLLSIVNALAEDWFFSVPALILTAVFLSRFIEDKKRYFLVLTLALLATLGIFCYVRFV